MEKSLASHEDKHRIAINKSKMDMDVAAEGEKTTNGALDGQEHNEPNNNVAGRADLEPALGSSKDTRIEPTSAPPPRVVLEHAPEFATDRRLKTPTRKKATEISNTGVHDEEPSTKVVFEITM